jgi:hypothetical protein
MGDVADAVSLEKAHSIGFRGGQLPSYGDDSAALDSPLIHNARSQDKL